jgi:glycosyltransferase involved in cell wall biosynthesis
MDTPLKILILALEFTPELSGGVGTHVLELATGLGELGHQVTVLAYASGKPTTRNQVNVTVQLVAPTAESLARAARLSMVQGILGFNDDLFRHAQALIEKQRPDIIQYYGWLTSSAARQLSEKYGIPLIGRMSYLSEPAERWWGQTPDPEIAQQEQELFYKSGMFISVSHWLSRLIQETHAVPCHNLHVIHNGLDVQRFVKQELNPKEIQALRGTIAGMGEKVVLFAGRLNPMKGISALFASASEVVKERPDVRYVMVGEADSRDFMQVIKRLFEQYPHLKDKVKLLGKVPRQQLAILYRIADIFLMPSLYEPFGWVAIEAMAAGLPLVSVDVGGPSEIVQHGQTGLLATIHARQTGPHEVDVMQLAEAQITLLNDNALAKQLGSNGRQRVITEFSLDKMVRKTLDVYRSTISASAGGYI